MHAALEQSLQSVPLLAPFGIRAEELRAGSVVLRLPHAPQVTNHFGALHNAAIFALGEVAAAVVLSTHPELGGYQALHKSTKIKYFAPSRRDVTAHGRVLPEAVTAALAALESGPAVIDVPVKVLDGHGVDIAELMCRFGLRAP